MEAIITYKQAQIDKELNEILCLQQQNLPINLSEKEIKQEGFLTVEHDFELLKKMNDDCSHTIAISENKVVADAL